MKCPKCGNEYQQTDKECPHCGVDFAYLERKTARQVTKEDITTVVESQEPEPVKPPTPLKEEPEPPKEAPAPPKKAPIEAPAKVQAVKKPAPPKKEEGPKVPCPKCNFENPPGSIDCFQCGIVFAKYEAFLAKQAAEGGGQNAAKTACPKCGMAHNVARDQLGSETTCKKCGNPFKAEEISV